MKKLSSLLQIVFLGRTILDDFIDRGKVVVKAGSVLSEKEAELIGDSGVESVQIRSVLTCDTKRGMMC